MTHTIRPVGAWEYGELASLAERFHAEAALGGTFNPDFFIIGWSNLQDKMAVGLFVEDKLVGVLVGFIAPQFMTGHLLAQELFWYVDPDFRGTQGSVNLLREFENWAASRKVFGIVMAGLLNSGVANLYAKRGYKPIESHHLKLL